MATLIGTDLFERADSVVNATPGSTTGLGNGWIDEYGGVWKILSGCAAHANVGGGFQTPARRPASDNAIPELMSAVFQCPPNGSGYDMGVEVRKQSDGSCYRAVISPITGLKIYRAGSGGGSPVELVTVGGVFVGGDWYRVSLAAATPVSGSTALEARAAAEASPNTPIATATASDNTAGLQGAGQFALNGEFYDGTPRLFREASWYNFGDGVWPTFGTTAIVPGDIAYGSADATTITINAVTSPTGGVGALTHSWHRSQTSGFTPGSGNVIAGQTGETLTGYAAGSGVWHYKRRCTDSLGSTADSNQVTAKVQDGVFGIKVGAIGDSRWAQAPSDGSSTLTIPQVKSILYGHAAGTDVAVTVVNRAIGGTTSGEWVPGAGTGYFEAALAAFQASGVTVVEILLGANDSSNLHAATAGAYGANMAAITAALTTAGIKSVLHYPAYIKPGALGGAFSQTSVALLQAYQPEIAALVDGVHVYRGDTQGFVEFSRHAEPGGEKWYIGDTVTGANPGGDDWVHPNARGLYAESEFQARATLPILGLGGSTTGEVDDVTGQQIIDGILDAPIETGISLRTAIAVIGAALAGTVSGMDTGTPTFNAMGIGGTSTPRIQSVAEDGNRSEITLIPPA